MDCALGVDTSNYTTSLCLVDEFGRVVSDQRRILNVASGSRGLRQSEALFQHVRNLPELVGDLSPWLQENRIVAIGVSTKPRPQENSYMPVFLPGTGLAHSLAHVLQVRCYELSHQEAHIWSGIGSAKGPARFRFLSVHLSGGTTELAMVNQDESSRRLQIDVWGGTSDLHAGQFVDRLGVKLGFPFPAGPALENLVREASVVSAVPISTFHREGVVSFSGPLTALERLLHTEPPEVLALSCFAAITRTLIKWISWAGTRTTCRELLIVGGVAANGLIRQELRSALPHWRIYFAKPQYSVDNAYGPAYFAALVSGLLASD